MASIISLEARRGVDRQSPVRESKGNVACEIVIFPGVRYERWEEPEATPAGRGGKSSRRRKDLVN